MQAPKKLTIKQKAKIGASIGLVVYVVVWEKKRVASMLLQAKEVFDIELEQAYQEGIKYGLTLEKTIRLVNESAAA